MYQYVYKKFVCASELGAILISSDKLCSTVHENEKKKPNTIMIDLSDYLPTASIR